VQRSPWYVNSLLLIATVPDASPAVPKRPATVYDLWMAANVVDELVRGPE
jgi:hypothetical protein